MTYSPEYHKDYYQQHKAKKRAQAADWERRNPEKAAEIRKRVAEKRRLNGKAEIIRKRWEAKNREYILWNAAKQRARKAGIPFTIEKADIIIPTHCPILGIPINRDSRGRMQPNSPSLDKIDPQKGYVPENIWVISWQANRMKSNASPDELRLFCVGMLNLVAGNPDCGRKP